LFYNCCKLVKFEREGERVPSKFKFLKSLFENFKTISLGIIMKFKKLTNKKLFYNLGDLDNSL